MYKSATQSEVDIYSHRVNEISRNVAKHREKFIIKRQVYKESDEVDNCLISNELEALTDEIHDVLRSMKCNKTIRNQLNEFTCQLNKGNIIIDRLLNEIKY